MSFVPDFQKALESVRKPQNSGAAMGSTAGLTNLMQNSAAQNTQQAQGFGAIPGRGLKTASPIMGGIKGKL